MKTIVKDFVPMGGAHCVTNSLKQVFSYYGHPLSEAMLLGIGSGINFAYLNMESYPMLTGRSKVFDFEDKIANRLQIDIRCRESKKYENAFKKAKDMIDSDIPVVVYVDMPFLEYLNLGDNSHFGGHAIVLVGYDDEKEVFYVSDRDNDDFGIRTPKGTVGNNLHEVSYVEMESARSSTFRPFPVHNKYLEIDFSGYNDISEEVLCAAINEACDNMLNPPANFLGVKGIQKLSKEILKWEKYDIDKRRRTGESNYFLVNKDGGTGGGAFRKLYGEFLQEADDIMQEKGLATLGTQFIELSKRWDLLGDLLWKLALTDDIMLLKEGSVLVDSLYQSEIALFTALRKAVNT